MHRIVSYNYLSGTSRLISWSRMLVMLEVVVVVTVVLVVVVAARLGIVMVGMVVLEVVVVVVVVVGVGVLPSVAVVVDRRSMSRNGSRGSRRLFVAVEEAAAVTLLEVLELLPPLLAVL
ncbi:hypothetical protein E2C01_095639 [Portunus trituberculatus]|uniref:Uncharacterized protein n=1 Tax=Portunus trituberculatus TaxID=210409 RepID=A0A5B7JVS9_PORTR|nr:hypothetical protein [Portunus trituberculatus]